MSMFFDFSNTTLNTASLECIFMGLIILGVALRTHFYWKRYDKKHGIV